MQSTKQGGLLNKCMYYLYNSHHSVVIKPYSVPQPACLQSNWLSSFWQTRRWCLQLQACLRWPWLGYSLQGPGQPHQHSCTSYSSEFVSCTIKVLISNLCVQTHICSKSTVIVHHLGLITQEECPLDTHCDVSKHELCTLWCLPLSLLCKTRQLEDPLAQPVCSVGGIPLRFASTTPLKVDVLHMCTGLCEIPPCDTKLRWVLECASRGT